MLIFKYFQWTALSFYSVWHFLSANIGFHVTRNSIRTIVWNFYIFFYPLPFFFLTKSPFQSTLLNFDNVVRRKILIIWICTRNGCFLLLEINYILNSVFVSKMDTASNEFGKHPLDEYFWSKYYFNVCRSFSFKLLRWRLKYNGND